MAREREPRDYKYMLRLPAPLGQALREQAKTEERSISRVIVRALTTYLSSPGRVLDDGTL